MPEKGNLDTGKRKEKKAHLATGGKTELKNYGTKFVLRATSLWQERDQGKQETTGKKRGS